MQHFVRHLHFGGKRLKLLKINKKSLFAFWGQTFEITEIRISCLFLVISNITSKDHFYKKKLCFFVLLPEELKILQNLKNFEKNDF